MSIQLRSHRSRLKNSAFSRSIKDQSSQRLQINLMLCIGRGLGCLDLYATRCGAHPDRATSFSIRYFQMILDMAHGQGLAAGLNQHADGGFAPPRSSTRSRLHRRHCRQGTTDERHDEAGLTFGHLFADDNLRVRIQVQAAAITEGHESLRPIARG